jgi:hypothetical protein
VLGDLEGGADPVREANPIRRRGLEHVQDELADGRRREPAVVEKLVEGAVGGDLLVAAVGRDQPPERVGRDCERPHRRDQGPDHGVRRAPIVVEAIDLVLEPVEEGQPVARRLVAELVGEAREAVDGEQPRALLAGKEAARDREVLAPGAGHHPLAAGDRDRGGRGRGAHRVHRASAITGNTSR